MFETQVKHWYRQEKIFWKNKNPKKSVLQKKMMKLTKEDTKNIFITALGGCVTFATLAFGNTLVRRKLVSKLKVEVQYLVPHDEMTMILLADVEKYVYDDIDPVGYIRLVDSCDQLVGLKIKLQQKVIKTENLDQRINAFLHLERAKESIERLKTQLRKKVQGDNAFSAVSSLNRIEQQLDQHFDIIYLLTKD